MSATRTPRRTPRARLVRLVSLSLIATSLVGFAAMGSPDPATAATDSSVTINWNGQGNGELQQYQPERSQMVDNADGSGHWNDFKDLSVTVGTTENLGDEVVTVEVSGFSAGSIENNGALNSNFVQAMQCWGPDPLAADFYETCMYGSHAFGFGSKSGVMDRGYRAIPTDASPITDHPFRTVTGELSEAYLNDASLIRDGLDRFFTPSTSNEIPYVPVTKDGTARFGFETLSSEAQPYLGCGDPESAAGSRCWLVLVPRGTHSGEWPAEQSTGHACNDQQTYPAGQVLPNQQVGSPVSPDCSLFANRIVVPLDFDSPRTSCPAGSAERRVVGSSAVAAVFSSWQPALCGENGAVFSLVSNPGDTARSQLLTGLSELAVVSRELTVDTIGPTDTALLDSADLGYAPVANTALTFGFVMSDTTTQVTDIQLTPRLIAKLLTQSYRSDVPDTAHGAGTVSESLASRTVVNLLDDPEWQALGNPITPQMTNGYIFVTPGPAGDDAISQLWGYVQADADAAAFLRGDPDPWGLTVNPYYLSAGHENAAGGGLPYDLSQEPIQTVPRADQTTASGMDSISWNSYAGSFASVVSRVSRADPQRFNVFDTQANQGAGGFVTLPPMLLTQARNFMGPMLAPAAIDYRMNTATLATPLDTRTSQDTVGSARTFVAATEATMSTAVEAQVIDPDTGIGTQDYAALPDDAYPLTFTMNAAVDLASTQLDGEARRDYAGLLRYAAEGGQVPGASPGQLPAGYVPLTNEQRALAGELANRLLVTAVESETVPGGTDAAGRSGPGGSDLGTPVGSDSPAGGPDLVSAAVTEDADTGAFSGSLALGAALLAGLAGMAGGPLLLRRRDGSG